MKLQNKKRWELTLWLLVIVLLVAKVIYIITVYADLPPRIAIHFDLHGEPNGFGERWSIWELFGIDLFVSLVMWAATKLPDSMITGFNDIPEEKRKNSRINMSLMMGITSLLTSLVLFYALWFIVVRN